MSRLLLFPLLLAVSCSQVVEQCRKDTFPPPEHTQLPMVSYHGYPSYPSYLVT